MKLLWIQIQDDDCQEIIKELQENGYRATIISSTEDFLNYGETTLLLGVEDDECDMVIEKIKKFYDDNAKKEYRSPEEKIFIYVLHSRRSVIQNMKG